MDTGRYHCFNKVVVYNSDNYWLGAMTFEDTAGNSKYIGFEDGLYSEETIFDMGDKGCLSGYDIWFRERFSSIETIFLFAEQNATRFDF